MTLPANVLLGALLLALAGPAVAQVAECRYPDGSTVYTDQACATLGATRAPDNAQPRLSIRYRNACARDLQELMYQLSTAIEVGDVNRVAESYDWAGMSNEAGQRTMDRLQGLIGRPVLDSRYLDASIGLGGGVAMLASSDPAAPTAGDAGMLQLLLADGDGGHATSIDFDVHRYAGCYFVAF